MLLLLGVVQMGRNIHSTHTHKVLILSRRRHTMITPEQLHLVRLIWQRPEFLLLGMHEMYAQVLL